MLDDLNKTTQILHLCGAGRIRLLRALADVEEKRPPRLVSGNDMEDDGFSGRRNFAILLIFAAIFIPPAAAVAFLMLSLIE